ncbi:hypothetical protein D3C72_1267030 [compost metagenome]
MAARSSSWRPTVVKSSDLPAARASSEPLRSSSSVKTWLTPWRNATLETQPKFLLLHTTTDGSALPTK